MDRLEWRDEYRTLKHPKSLMSPQERGFSYEKVLWMMLHAAGLDPRQSYRVKGEQIDGAFKFGDRIFLLEARWTDRPVNARELYAFQGVVDRKSKDAFGAFFSMGGYKQVAIDNLARRSPLNLILFDESDMDAVASEIIGFRELLSLKLRAAAEEGIPFAPISKKLIEDQTTQRFPIVADSRTRLLGRLGRLTRCASCEAASIAKTYSRIEENTGRRYRVEDLTAPGSVGNLSYEWHGVRPCTGRQWKYLRENMDKLLADGKIQFRTSGLPVRKRYLDERQSLSRAQ